MHFYVPNVERLKRQMGFVAEALRECGYQWEECTPADELADGCYHFRGFMLQVSETGLTLVVPDGERAWICTDRDLPNWGRKTIVAALRELLAGTAAAGEVARG